MNKITKRANGSKRQVWSNPAKTKEALARYNGASWPEDLAEGEELPEMTKQEFKLECDINTIINNYMRTGDEALLRKVRPYYGDVSKLPKNFHESLVQIQQAQEAFDTLPAKIRSKFNNDPGELLGFIMDPKNKDQAIELGIFEKPVVQAGSAKATPQAAPGATETKAPEGEPKK